MKRAIDVAVAAGLLVVVSPLLAGVALAIRVSMGRPVLFRQMRLGKDGAPFMIYKFRTMATTLPHRALRDQDRITPLGYWLRLLSLDELPQLWNVVQGQMALVGPRPLLLQYAPWFTERERMRFAVRPGITGWAQVNGRANVPWDDRLEMDAWYVEHRSLVLDLEILARTALRVLGRTDVHPDASPRLQHDLNVERSLKQQHGRVHLAGEGPAAAVGAPRGATGEERPAEENGNA